MHRAGSALLVALAVGACSGQPSATNSVVAAVSPPVAEAPVPGSPSEPPPPAPSIDVTTSPAGLASPVGPGTPTAAATPRRTPAPSRPPDLPSLTELMESARSISYEQLLGRPERYVGDLVYFAGRVREVTDDGSGRFQASINVGDGRELLIVYYADRYFGHPLVQGDRIRFVGTFLGLLQNSAGEARPAVEVVDLLIRFT